MRQFDLVVLKTIKNVRYLSGPAGRPAKPQGVWIVTSVFGDNTVLLSKDETVIRIPQNDVQLVGKYDLEVIRGKLKEINDKFKGRTADRTSGKRHQSNKSVVRPNILENKNERKSSIQ